MTKVDSTFQIKGVVPKANSQSLLVPPSSSSGSSAVSSVFTRVGDIVATNGDYSFNLISGSLDSSQLPLVIDCGYV